MISLRFFVALCFLGVAAGLTLQSLSIRYHVMDLAPDVSTKIKVLPGISSPEACLMACGKTEDCKSVVEDGSTCTLYNTTDSSVVLTTGQTAISEVAKSARYA